MKIELSSYVINLKKDDCEYITIVNFDELKKYVLEHRTDASSVYQSTDISNSKFLGFRLITVSTKNPILSVTSYYKDKLTEIKSSKMLGETELDLDFELVYEIGYEDRNNGWAWTRAVKGLETLSDRGDIEIPKIKIIVSN